MEIIKLYKTEKYPNLLTKINLTSADIEQNIKNYTLEILKYKNTRVERELELPIMLKSFYSFVLKNNKIPNQKECWDNYLNINKDYFNDNQFNEDELRGIKARVSYRSYTALIRELHFNKYLSENLESYNVKFNIDLDMYEGIDTMIENENEFYGIDLFVSSPDSDKWRNKKKTNRHIPFVNVNKIELPLILNEGKKCGRIILYTHNHYKELISKINFNKM